MGQEEKKRQKPLYCTKTDSKGPMLTRTKRANVNSVMALQRKFRHSHMWLLKFKRTFQNLSQKTEPWFHSRKFKEGWTLTELGKRNLNWPVHSKRPNLEIIYDLLQIQETSKKDFSAVRTYLRKYFNPNRESKTLPRELSHFCVRDWKDVSKHCNTGTKTQYR